MFYLYSQAVESLALMACENVDNDNSEPVMIIDGDMPDLLTPISHSGVSNVSLLCSVSIDTTLWHRNVRQRYKYKMYLFNIKEGEQISFLTHWPRTSILLCFGNQ